MIEANALTKRYGTVTAVDDLSFTVPPGRVTGFLGPNGAGKTTTMRMILGLDLPNHGSVRVCGRQYHDLPAPLYEVGALLDAKYLHPGRTAYNHLLCLAQSNGIARRRVDEVLGIVGLERVARRRAGGYSLGMGQRLGIAAALLGDPGVLMFDEPVNGLDPEGIRWIRQLMHHLASEGRTVLVSSHLMSEMAVTAQHLIVIGRGRLIAESSVEEFIASSSRRSVLVRTPQAPELADRLRQAGATTDTGEDGALVVTGMDSPGVGQVAASAGIVLHELTPQHASLEEAFMELTKDSLDFTASGGDHTGSEPAIPVPETWPGAATGGDGQVPAASFDGGAAAAGQPAGAGGPSAVEGRQ
jgi:ABC-2 type transport system ATP-binding protein